MGPKNWRNWGKIALLRPLWLKWRPNMSKWVHITSQPAECWWMGVIGLVGTPFGLSGTSREPKRGILGQKTAFLGPGSQQKGPIPGQSVLWRWAQPSWTKGRQLGPNQAPQGCPRTSGALKRALLGQNGPLLGPQECRRGLLRGPSTWCGCNPPSWTNQWQSDQIWPHGMSGAPKRTFLGQNRPFWGPQGCSRVVQNGI